MTSERPSVHEVVLQNDDRHDDKNILVLSAIGDVLMVRIAEETPEAPSGVITRTTKAEMFVSLEAFVKALPALEMIRFREQP